MPFPAADFAWKFFTVISHSLEYDCAESCESFLRIKTRDVLGFLLTQSSLDRVVPLTEINYTKGVAGLEVWEQ